MDDNNLYMGTVIKTACLLAGIWPNIFKSKLLRYLYAFHSNLAYWYQIYFMCSQLAIMPSYDSSTNSRIICIFIQNLNNILAVTIIKGKRIQNLFQQATTMQKRVLQSENKELIDIYTEFAKKTKMLYVYYVASTYFSLIVFNFGHYMNSIYYFNQEDFEASGLKQRPLPMPAWVPLPAEFVNKHYNIIFLTNLYAGNIGGFYLVTSQAFVLMLILYARGQFCILQYFVKNLNKYSKNMAKGSDLPIKIAEKRCVKFCVQYHNDIINYVTTLNKSMNLLVLLGFCMTSVQNTMIIFDMLTKIDYTTFFSATFLIISANQIIILYWNANELQINGTEVALAVGKSYWYQLSTENQQGLKLLILRAQKPVVMKAGPFVAISNELTIKTFKATYSYTMLMGRSYDTPIKTD